VGRLRQYISYLADGGAPPADGAGKHTHLSAGQGLDQPLADGGLVFESGWDAAGWNDEIPSGPGAAGTWTANLSSCGSGDSTWTSDAGGQENLPSNCVSWAEAYAFCIWDGGFLPSTYEWLYAAEGGSAMRIYPWGGVVLHLGPAYAIENCNYPPLAADTCAPTAITNIAPVGTASLGAGLWGQIDLVGEVMQWNLDWSDPDAPPPPFCADCAIVTAPAQGSGGVSLLSDAGPAPWRALRGGLFNSGLLAYENGATPNSANPTIRNDGIGFRCARSP